MTENEVAIPERKTSKVDQFMMQVLPEQDRQAIRSALPRHVPFERFERNLVNALMNEPKLLTCNPREVFREIAKIAGLGLVIDPQLGEAYLIVGFNGRDQRNVPQIRIGYRGMIKLGRQSGEIATIYSREICPADEFECIEGTDRFLTHKPDYFAEERGEPVGYYSVVQFKDRTTDFEVMGLKGINKIRDRSDGWKAFTAGRIKSTPWSTDYDEMAKKTVMRRLMKRMPQSPELAAAQAIEDAAEDGDFQPAPSSRLNPAKAGIIERLQQRDTSQSNFDPETGEIGQDEEAPQKPMEAEKQPEATKTAEPSKPQPTATNEKPARKERSSPLDDFVREAATATTEQELAEMRSILIKDTNDLDGFSQRSKNRVDNAIDEARNRIETLQEQSNGQADAGEEQEAGDPQDSTRPLEEEQNTSKQREGSHQLLVARSPGDPGDEKVEGLPGRQEAESAPHASDDAPSGSVSGTSEARDDLESASGVDRDDDPPRVFGFEVDEEGLPVGEWSSFQKRRWKNVIKDLKEANNAADAVAVAEFYRSNYQTDKPGKPIFDGMIAARLEELKA